MGLLCLLVWTAEEVSEVAEIGNEQKELQGDTQRPRFRDSCLVTSHGTPLPSANNGTPSQLASHCLS